MLLDGKEPLIDYWSSQWSQPFIDPYLQCHLYYPFYNLGILFLCLSSNSLLEYCFIQMHYSDWVYGRWQPSCKWTCWKSFHCSCRSLIPNFVRGRIVFSLSLSPSLMWQRFPQGKTKENFVLVICDSSIQVNLPLEWKLHSLWPSPDKHWFQGCDFQVPTAFGVDACGDTNTSHSAEL